MRVWVYADTVRSSRGQHPEAPRLAFPVVGPMSFAELGRTAKVAHEKFVAETITRFMKECRAVAAQGCFSCEVGFEKPKCLDDQIIILDVKRKLDEMGFESWEVQPTYAKNCFNIRAKWTMKSPEPEKTEKGQQGTSSTCPVCFENRPIVALTPCGHVVCQQCQGSRQFRQCPMCRGDVTGATKALFLWDWIAYIAWQVRAIADMEKVAHFLPCFVASALLVDGLWCRDRAPFSFEGNSFNVFFLSDRYVPLAGGDRFNVRTVVHLIWDNDLSMSTTARNMNGPQEAYLKTQARRCWKKTT